VRKIAAQHANKSLSFITLQFNQIVPQLKTTWLNVHVSAPKGVMCKVLSNIKTEAKRRNEKEADKHVPKHWS